MLLLIDIGNTSASYGFYREGRLEGARHISSHRVPMILMKMLRKFKAGPKVDIAITSVVPKMTRKIRELTKKRDSLYRLWVAGENLRVPIKHKYSDIKKLGTDRAVNAYGAIKIYGPPPLLILDYGTALTCDYLSKKGVFLGGLIVPGPEISLQALCERAALLPRIPFPKGYSHFIGPDTVGGMKAGVLQGYGAMTDGLVERFRSRYGKFRVVATGGLSQVIARYTSLIDIVDPLLTLKSLLCVFKNHIKEPMREK